MKWKLLPRYYANRLNQLFTQRWRLLLAYLLTLLASIPLAMLADKIFKGYNPLGFIAYCITMLIVHGLIRALLDAGKH